MCYSFFTQPINQPKGSVLRCFVWDGKSSFELEKLYTCILTNTPKREEPWSLPLIQ